jgi:hypothetical protein
MDGWSLLRVEGSAEFCLVGILSSLKGTLAAAGIPVFAVSPLIRLLLFTPTGCPDDVTLRASAIRWREMPESV